VIKLVQPMSLPLPQNMANRKTMTNPTELSLQTQATFTLGNSPADPSVPLTKPLRRPIQKGHGNRVAASALSPPQAEANPGVPLLPPAEEDKAMAARVQGRKNCPLNTPFLPLQAFFPITYQLHWFPYLGCGGSG
jgi:hypothetical protein